jgi:hypothetical protein
MNGFGLFWNEFRRLASCKRTGTLWRRIPPFHFFFDENLGRNRPSTAAFEDHPDGTPNWQESGCYTKREA